MREAAAVGVGAHDLVDDEVGRQKGGLAVEDVLDDAVDGVELVRHAVPYLSRQLTGPVQTQLTAEGGTGQLTRPVQTQLAGGGQVS